MNFYRYRPDGRWPFSAGITAATAVVVGGTVGFMWIESWGLLDAFYMTVITLSTVGFEEVRPLSDAGRVFAVGLILGGVATLGYALGAFGDRIVEAPKRRLERRIRQMKDHIVVCGYGRMAHPVVTGLLKRRKPVCVIERSGERVENASRLGISAIQGDATAEEILERAGVRRAAAVAALLPRDQDNLSITMTVTALRPGIRVIARSEEERSRANLERAGARADDVFSPHTTAGRAVLRSLCSPGAARLLHDITEMTQGGFDAGEFLVTAESGLPGKTLTEAAIGEGRDVLVLAIQHAGGEMSVAPRGEERLRSGDTVILLGHSDDLKRLGAHPKPGPQDSPC